MHKKLLYAVALLTASLGFSQTYGTYETNAEGKLFLKSENSSIPADQTNYRAPVALNLDWTLPDFDVSNNPTKDSWDSRMDVGSNGNVYVVYNDNYTNGLQKIMFRKKEGQNWSAPIYVDKGVDIGDRNNHFPAIAVSPNDDLHVTYNVWAFENGRNFVAYSHYIAASDTWTDGIKISDLNGTVNHTSSHHSIYTTDNNLPVVVWGFDNRENGTNEEIYMTYFDGANWSADMPVSDITDGLNAGYPHIKSIGNNQAMIIYSEVAAGGNWELRYKIYDEDTHDLSAAKVVSSTNVGMNNFNLITTNSGEVMILTLHKDGTNDIFNIYNYEETADTFNLSTNTLAIAANAGGLLKTFTMDCNSEEDCAVIFSDYLAEKNFFLEYNQTDGFGTPEVINNEKPALDPLHAKFDGVGNLHIVWQDMRFDDGQGFDEREVFYKMAKNLTVGIDDVSVNFLSVFPNPSRGSFTIQTQDSYTMEIYDVLGKMVDSQLVEGNTNISTRLSSGTYILHFINHKGTWTKRLLIE